MKFIQIPTSTYFNVPRQCIIVVFIAAATSLTGCEDFLTIDPPKNQLVTDVVFENDATASAAMNGIYSQMMTSASSFLNVQITQLAGLSSDELIDYTIANTKEFYDVSINPSNPSVTLIWRNTYQFIYMANAIIEGVDKAASLSAGIKNQLEGEAKFIRAIAHFYLLNLYGDVPYLTSTDYMVNNGVARMNKADVYQLIVSDLLRAQELMGEEYYTTERVRPNKFSATAMLARVYLFTGDFAKAEEQATAIINNTSRYGLVTDLNAVFLKNSREAIWQLMPVTAGRNTNEGRLFILTTVPTAVSLSPQIFNAFETGDLRKARWTGTLTTGGKTYYYPFKYKIAANTTVTEYSMVLRLAEQYLIRAEARARNNDLEGAKNDINIIRGRAGLANTTANDQPSTLNAIMQERKVELFTENGHRWIDMKRTGMATSVLQPLKGANWQDTDMLYPVPTSQIQNDYAMHDQQNPGY